MAFSAEEGHDSSKKTPTILNLKQKNIENQREK